MQSISLKSPAKINLSLDIIGKSCDKYHLLRTIIQTINIFDYITFNKNDSKKINIHQTGLTIPPYLDNIIYKTAIQFFKQTNIPFSGLDIKITKNIPLQAGLGGGSSNAATTLLALNNIFNANLTIFKLQEIGLSLGADVPLFFSNGTCLCEGIGEIITPLPEFPMLYFIVVKPKVGFSTADVYKKFDSIKISKHPNTNKIINAIFNNDINEICHNIYNVLEEAIPNTTEIFNIKKSLLSYGALNSSMTGSGSAVFGIFNNKYKAEKSFNILKNVYPHVFLCHPIQLL